MKNSTDRWVKCISTQGNIRGVAIEAADLIQTLADRHGLTGDAIVRLGEAVMGALMIASYCKQVERVNLNIRGAGQIQQALVDAYPDGTARGYVVKREISGSLLDQKTGPWGSGVLSVLRAKTAGGEKPYIGTVPLLTGHLAKDLSFYWFQSEQLPSAVGLAVNVSKDKVESAGGFLVQVLAGANEEEVKRLEQHVQAIESLAESLKKNADPVRLLSQIFQSTAFMMVEEKPLRFKCQCSWERVQRTLLLVGVEELQSMLNQEQATVVRCDFCAAEYSVDRSTIENLIRSII